MRVMVCACFKLLKAGTCAFHLGACFKCMFQVHVSSACLKPFTAGACAFHLGGQGVQSGCTFQFKLVCIISVGVELVLDDLLRRVFPAHDLCIHAYVCVYEVCVCVCV